MGYRTPLSKVEGLGSAHSGVEHFWKQRVTATALVPLSIWFCVAMLGLVGADRDAIVEFLHAPLHAVLMILFVLSVLMHMALGMEVVIEDYLPKTGQRIAARMLMRGFTWLVGAACLFALFKIAV